ncbi:MAG: hypothetical protein Tsb009_17530 [Planctomycetaceae bacterium]
MSRESIYEASLDYFLEPIRPFLQDERVTEIMVNGHDEIYVERGGQLYETDAQFESADALLTAVHNVAQYVGREIDEERPILDARLPNGSRVHAVIPPSARRGTYLTIRKFRRDIFSLEDFVRLGSLSDSAREFLEFCVQIRKNIIVAGGTGTGKTTFLNALSTAIPAEERIVVIEDSSELQLNQKHTLYLESQQEDAYGRGGLTIRQLFVASLRMRPDRIIVGEVRRGEALDMVQSMISGHSGSLTTVHADTPTDAMIRLETLSMMSEIDVPATVAKKQVGSAIDLIVQLARHADDGSRKVVGITEACGLNREGDYQFRTLFELKRTGQREDGHRIMELVPTGEKPTFAGELYEHGLEDRVQLTKDLWDM